MQSKCGTVDKMLMGEGDQENPNTFLAINKRKNVVKKTYPQ